MDKGFVIAYELTAETYSKNINDENTPMKFENWNKAIRELNKFSKGCIFQIMTIGKSKISKYQVP